MQHDHDFQYRPSAGLRNPHFQSIAPTVFRKLGHGFKREKLELDDGDFLLLDWWQQQSKRLVVLTHGLEGHSRRSYMLGMARWFYQNGWDVLSWNFRSCGGELNRLPRFYHSGAIEDLSAVVNHALALHDYDVVSMVGFSMGGNQTLVYLAQPDLPEQIRSAAVFSVPCDLAGCADVMAEPGNQFYMNRFIQDLGVKVKQKARQFPEQVSAQDYHLVKNFHDFDERYTAPLHGFKDRWDYWHQSSSQRFLGDVQVPALLVNALDDPFLSPGCYPDQTQLKGTQVQMLTPRHGGHVGFIRYRFWKPLWSEQTALKFCQQYLP